ncbi:hypothetical protein L6164_011087 [Bauhinia variegata]|uniref:Uncharacterized protein n=1 Tax=Bauhinia variegata TaxID=167791 RepID=A0ACB9P5G1_BAUVA|nr:hypothetical protein L6164_011087 [Bauhinia variegata]
MGNCQAIDAASLVIQYPCGKVERMYWPVSAGDVMKANPGHYVALLISTTTLCQSNSKPNENCPSSNDNNTPTPVRITRIKLLKPTDTLGLGQVYRLINTQEVMRGLWSKKQAKMKKNMSVSAYKPDLMKEKPGLEKDKAARSSEPEDNQATKAERHKARTAASSNNGSAPAKSRAWQPSLHSISEANS